MIVLSKIMGFKDTHFLTPGIYDYVRLHGKGRKIACGIKIATQGIIADYLGGSDITTRVFPSGKGGRRGVSIRAIQYEDFDGVADFDDGKMGAENAFCL